MWRIKPHSEIISNSMKNIYLFLFATLFVTHTYSQSVSLYLPHFADQEWYLTIFRGEDRDTIATGKLDQEGKVKITLPDTYKNYRGMAQWRLNNGGGLDLIFSNAENFSVSCLEAQPSEETIKYNNTPENTYLIERYKQQQQIFAKADAMRMAVYAYKDDKKLLPMFESEFQKQKNAYNNLQLETVNKPLYAAVFSQIVDITREQPQTLDQTPDEALKWRNDFIIGVLDIDALYTSGHWMNVLGDLAAMYTDVDVRNKYFVRDMAKLLDRCKHNESYIALSKTLIQICERKGWSNQQKGLEIIINNQSQSF